MTKPAAPLLGLFLFALNAACGAPDLALAQPAAHPAPAPVTPPVAHVQIPAPAAAAPARPGRDFPDLPEKAEPEAVWGDGADVLVVASSDEVFRIERTGAIAEGRGPEHAANAVFTAGPQGHVAVVGERGEFAFFDGTTWEFALAPALDGEGLAGAAIDASGKLLLAGRHRALYVREGSTWKIFPYGSGGVDAIHAALAQDGTLFVVGAHGRVLSFSGGAFKDVVLSGITADVLNTRWLGAYLPPGSKTMWIATERFVIGADLAGGPSKSFPSPLFFEIGSFSGARVGGTDLLLLGTMSDYALFDGKDFYKVDSQAHHSDSLYVDPKRGTFYEVEWRKMQRFDLKHPALGTGKADVLPARP
jgi:hypothetical protein